MKRYSFRTAHKSSSLTAARLGAGLLLAGLALTASARDGSAPAQNSDKVAGNVQQTAKATHKPRKWLQIGIASWYGTHFQGRTTAAGEQYDMNEMTCAHPTLPMGTWLRVTNLRNRRMAYVRVNDRGPVVDGRVVDLSFAAARRLGLHGIGKVKLETVRENDPELRNALMAEVKIPIVQSPGLR